MGSAAYLAPCVFCISTFYRVVMFARYVAKPVKQNETTHQTRKQDLWIKPWGFPFKLLLHLSSSTFQESWQVYPPRKIADSFTSEEEW